MNQLNWPALSDPEGIRRVQEMKFGATLIGGGVRFRLWAPQCHSVSLRLEGEEAGDRPMHRLPRGWFELEVEGIGAGTRYSFVLPHGQAVPDPASRFQPDDVHGPSEVIDPRAFVWRDLAWRGRPWEETILYELHVGSFTPEGTYMAAIERLDHLVSLGITAIELMPLNEFPGRWNWGYDGVLLFAPEAGYGRPEDLKAFIEAAHQRNLMVFLDVVYNHFGPAGNYMSSYSPQLTDEHQTPWGDAVNLDSEGSANIRDFLFANARYWLNEYRFDGLRFDAVHAIRDSRPTHFLEELARQLRAVTDGRYTHLVDENCKNEARWLVRDEELRPILYDAQWSDDIHHCLHTLATGEGHTYYADYAGRADLTARALAEGFAYQGDLMQDQRVPMGEPSAQLPATAFVSFVQNHDHVGNRPYGERLHRLAPRQAVRTLAAINLLSPHIPLLFMGEEWASDRPFLFFSDVDPDLADAIRKGQKEQNEAFQVDPAQPPPDPMAEATFLACKLDWEVLDAPEHRDWLDHYRRLIAVRQAEIVPRLGDMTGNCGTYELIGKTGVRVHWILGDGSRLSLSANLSEEPVELGEREDLGRELWADGERWGGRFGSWALTVHLRGAEGSE